MNQLERVMELIRTGLIAITPQPPWAPYATGQLRDNIVDGITINDNSASMSLLGNPLVYYGIILNNAPSIRYGLKKSGVFNRERKTEGDRTYIGSYRYVRRDNKHYHYLDNYFNNEAAQIVERELGAKRIW